MGSGIGDDRRIGVHAAAGVLAALLALVVLSNVLWPPPSPQDPAQPRFPPDASPFPAFRMGPALHAVSLDPASNLSTRLLWVSLQGLVNREQVELYVDFGGDPDNVSATLVAWEHRYALAHDVLSPEVALDRYARRWNGTIVYDPARPESINIGTMLASRMGGLLVGPDLAGWMRTTYGLSVLFDYAAERDWTALDRIGAYDRALRELYPTSNPSLLAILPPERWAIRDYLIATGTFVFYLPQGMFASPFDLAATTRILRAAPRGIPVLGWFDSPTETEENAFLQLVSREGKFVVGAQRVPNLSVLTALGRTNPHRQAPPAIPGPLEDRTYVVLAIPDGDNLDFLTGRMRDLWSEPVRGTVPIAWSISPLLVDLAPPLLDEYYEGATPGDRFIAAPSGAGYLYPDYAAPGDLESFVAFSRGYLEAADLDIVWLLNAFPASEIPYSAAALGAYVDGLEPRGMVLDYADQPRTRDAWMAAGARAVAPVIRSTHFWTSAENVRGKIGAAAATRDSGPRFLWLTLYPFRFGLRDAAELLDTLRAQIPGGVEVVTPETFFALLREDFVRRGIEAFRSMEGDPLASSVFRGVLETAQRRLLEAEVAMGAGDPDRAAAAAYQALEELRGIRAGEALLLSALVLLGAGVLAAQAHRTGVATRRATRGDGRGTHKGWPPTEGVRLEPLAFLTAAVALFTFALREALVQNFWTYPTILLGVAVASFHRPLRRIVDRAWGDRAPAIASLLALVFASLAVRTTAAFSLALLGTLLALDAYVARRPVTNPEALLGLCFGVALGFAGGFELVTLTGVALLLVVPAVRLRAAPRAETAPRSGGAIRGLLLVLPVTALAVAFSYSFALRFDVQGERLVSLAAAFLIVPPTLAVLVRGPGATTSPRRRTLIGLAFAGGFALAILGAAGTVPATLLLLGLFTSLATAALGGLDGGGPAGRDTAQALAVALVLLPLLLLFLRIPPIAYSLVLVRLPEALEYALYAPTAWIAGTSFALFLVVLLRDRVSIFVGKHYPTRGNRRAGGP